MSERLEFVSTDCDLWNSADGSGLFVSKGQVKAMVPEITPIIDDALNQGLLRKPTMEEMSKFHFENDMELALKERKISPGKNYEETVSNYQKYVAELEEQKSIKEIEVIPSENLEESTLKPGFNVDGTKIQEEGIQKSKNKKEN